MMSRYGSPLSTTRQPIVTVRSIVTVRTSLASLEGADASVSLMIRHTFDSYVPPFELVDYSVQMADTPIPAAFQGEPSAYGSGSFLHKVRIGVSCGVSLVPGRVCLVGSNGGRHGTKGSQPL